jgi:hypothetical protein
MLLEILGYLLLEHVLFGTWFPFLPSDSLVLNRRHLVHATEVSCDDENRRGGFYPILETSGCIVDRSCPA